MSTIVTRTGKGSALTWVEGDANFTNLNTDKYESGDSPTFVTIDGTTLNISGSSVFLGATYYQAAASVASGDWRFRQAAGIFYQDYYNGSSWANLISYASFGVGITNSLNVGVTLTVAGDTGLVLTDGNIKFPTTQVPSANAYTLDDYRELSYTPTILAETGSITSYTIDSGQVTKIGRVVTASCIITITDAGTGADALLVTAPYTAGHGAVGQGRETAVSNVMLSALLLSAGTYILIEKYDGTTCIATGATIHFSITYMV